MPIKGRNTTSSGDGKVADANQRKMQLFRGGFADTTQKKDVYYQEGLPDLIDMLLLFNSFYLFCYFFLIKRMESDSGLSP